jgi:hypothetical protein
VKTPVQEWNIRSGVLNNFMVQVFNLAIGNIQQYIFHKLM